MKLTQLDKGIEEILRNLSGKTIEDIDDILKSLLIYTLMQYSENEMVRIPYFGSFKIKYTGDTLTSDGREAELETLYFPSNEVKLNLGMLEDVRNGKGEIISLPIIQELMRGLNIQLQKITNDIKEE